METGKSERPLDKQISFWSQLLRVSTFYKILIANSILILMGTAAGLWISSHHSQQLPIIAALSAIVVTGVLINSFLIRLALQPLTDLSEIMREVGQGNFRLRARPHPLAEEAVAVCYRSLNQMLDTLERTMASLKEAQERARLHARHVIAAQEEERKRIARELHDETSQVLASLILGLEKVRIEMPNISPQCVACKEDVGSLKGLTDKALIELHRLAFNLRPSLIDDMGLKQALSQLLREQVEEQGIGVVFHWEGSEERLPGETEITLFRIIQEAITNAVKYAQARKISVALRRNPDKVNVEITDNGTGFDPEAVKRKKTNGLGLRGMEERVSLLQGSFDLQSGAGKGTRIMANIPIKPIRS